MLHILFLILKIIGIILLVILGIAIVLAGAILFIPIRYCLKIETTDGLKDLRTEIKANWLFHLIKAYVLYQDEKFIWKLRVAWKKFDKQKSEIDETTKYSVDDEHPRKQEDTEETKDTKEIRKDEIKQEDAGFSTDTKKTSFIEKIKCTIKTFCDKIKKIKEIVTDETHLQALLCLKNEILFLLKKVKPRKIRGYVKFGLKDPYDTGRVLALLSILYPFYGESLEIYPEFDKEIIEGNVYMKGRITSVYLLLTILKLYFNENIKKAHKKYKEIKE